MTVNEGELKNFLDLYSLKSMVREPTCLKSENPKCIDLILTNRDKSAHNKTTIETGLSDFHKMIYRFKNKISEDRSIRHKL